MANQTASRRYVPPYGRWRSDMVAVPGSLLAVAAIGWWWSARMSDQMAGNREMSMHLAQMSISFSTFIVGWVSMMAAMMFPAIVPVVLTFRRASSQGKIAPTPYFVAGYLLVWSAIGVPAYWAWRTLQGPVDSSAPWAARLAGTVFVIAGLYQVSPLKAVCLQHCQTPMSFFVKQHQDLRRPLGAARAGAVHGSTCFGCCWALMAILVALGTMQLTWMVIIATLIFLEKLIPRGGWLTRSTALAFMVMGFSLLLHPALLGRLT